MVGTLTGPTAVVHGSTSPLRQTLLHLAGLLTSALPTGALLGALGGLSGLDRLGAAGWTAWAVLGVAYGLHELGLLRLPTPQRRRQVPHVWRRTLPPRTVAFRYGLLLGPGFLVYVRSAAYYLVVAGALLSGSAAIGATAFGLVAVGRIVPLLASSAHQSRGGALPAFLERTVRLDPWARLLTGVLLVAGGALALVP